MLKKHFILKCHCKNCLCVFELFKNLQLVPVVFLFLAAWWGWGATGSLVEFSNDWLNDIFQLFLLCLECVTVGFLVLLQPRDLLVDGLFNLFLVGVGQLGAQLVLIGDLVLERVGV